MTTCTANDPRAASPGLRVLVTAGGVRHRPGHRRHAASPMARKVHVCDVSERRLAEFRDRASGMAGVAGRRFRRGRRGAACSATCAETLGGLDALINNAGIAGPTGGVEEITPPTGAAASTST